MRFDSAASEKYAMQRYHLDSRKEHSLFVSRIVGSTRRSRISEQDALWPVNHNGRKRRHSIHTLDTTSKNKLTTEETPIISKRSKWNSVFRKK